MGSRGKREPIVFPYAGPLTETEWGWFRASFADALFHPRRFARNVAREHFGLAGVVVAVLAGIALSVTIDVAIILSKGADPLSFLIRIVLDAVLLALRLAVVAALLGLLAVGISRALRRPIDLDQAFTALAFAMIPLVVAPVVIVLMVVALELPDPYANALRLAALAVTLVLVARLILGVALNLGALVGRAAIVVAGAALLAGAFILQDQIGRVTWTALSYAPQILRPPAAAPALGSEVRLATGTRMMVPAGWREASRGVPGIVAQYELPDARLTVRQKDVSILTTADSFAASETEALRRDFTRIDRSGRALVRIDDVAATDDRWYGHIDEVRLVQRVYTVVVGTTGYLFEFRYFSPADEEVAVAQAAAIAASIRLAKD